LALSIWWLTASCKTTPIDGEKKKLKTESSTELGKAIKFCRVSHYGK